MPNSPSGLKTDPYLGKHEGKIDISYRIYSSTILTQVSFFRKNILYWHLLLNIYLIVLIHTRKYPFTECWLRLHDIDSLNQSWLSILALHVCRNSARQWWDEYLLYGIEVYGQANKTAMQPLQIQQNRSTKFSSIKNHECIHVNYTKH